MSSIWAVAINTLRQALRMKIAVVFIILLLVLLPLMGLTMTGDGTIKGRLQSFVSYGLSLTSLLLCLLTIAVSTYSLTSDIEQRQIYTVITKPIRRFQLILGKLLGVILLDIGLLVLFAGLIYTITVYTPKLSSTSEAELDRLANEFLTARAGLLPAEVDVSREVEQTYDRLEKSGQLPPGVAENKLWRKNYKIDLAERIKLSKRAAGPGQELLWKFHDVTIVEPARSFFIKFKYDVSVNPPDLQVSSKWFVGDDRQLQIETPIYAFDRRDLIRTSYEIEVPADAVAEDGYLAVSFLNDPQFNNTVVIFPPKDGLEVLYKADTFGANFLRAAILVLFRLIFLACLGILASSFLSFPVAILLCLVVFFTGTISGFVLDSFDSIGENISNIYSYSIKPLVRLLPQFDKYNPTKFLVPARLVSWSLLARVAGLMVCIKAFLLLALAMVIFSYREIAKVII